MDRASPLVRLADSFFRWHGEIWFLVLQTARHLFAARWIKSLTLEQFSLAGYACLPICLLTVAAGGAVLSLYTAGELVTRGGARLVGWLVAYTVLREVSPVATGLVVAARMGSAYAAQIGSMKVTEQIDGLTAMGISPIAFLVVPRVLACALVTPLLCALSDLAGLIGGSVVAAHSGVAYGIFWRSVQDYLDFGDFFWGVIKGVPFGLIVAFVSCHCGLKTEGGAVGVGRSTTEAVVISFVLIYATDYLLSTLLPR
ncbi:MAG: ABC transporter permease [Armatimonadetes bacterium]|nr:ABC transporter permease [Armatimonadota bacterium]MDW8120728.1 ABC transporter permease [Armatimonadota bacterium]